MSPKSTISCFFSLAAFLLVSAAAAQPYLVKDISLGFRPLSSSPQFVANAGNLTYFSVVEPTRNLRLWKTDGTEGGTTQVPALGYFFGGVPLGNSFLAVALDSLSVRQLWLTDGTSGGTTMLTNGGSNVRIGSVAGDGSAAYYFASQSGQVEVWRANGTASGNMKLAQFSATNCFGIASTTSSTVFAKLGGGDRIMAVDMSGASPQIVTTGTLLSWSERMGSITVFEILKGATIQLWKTDGTAAGTSLLRDGFAGTASFLYVRMGGSFYFTADDGVNGTELWRTDGSIGGTALVADLTPGVGSTEFRGLTATGGTLYFFANAGIRDGLWRSDGTAAGTTLAKDGLATAQLLTASKGIVFFSWDDGVHGLEPWLSDGSLGGTVLLRDINPGAASSMDSQTAAISRPDGRVLFSASNGVNGIEPWISDGTAAGTRLLKDVAADGANGSFPRAFANVAGRLMFIVSNSDGNAVWTSDGSNGGTRRIATVIGGDTVNAVASGGLYYFTQGHSGAMELWRSDGTSAGTFPLFHTPNFLQSSVLISLNNGVAFNGNDGTHGAEPWFSDGTLAGTRMISDLNPGAAGSYANSTPAVSKGLLYFSAETSPSGSAPWRSDGTAAGTMIITAQAKDPRAFTDVNGTIFFATYLHDAAFDLWRTDGFSAGTVNLRSFNGEDHAPSLMWNVGGKLLFMLPRAGELWRSDGTPAGTVLVSKVSVPRCVYREDYAVLDGVLYWTVVAISSFELWRSDGTAAGTHKIDTAIDASLTNEQECVTHPIVAAGTRLYFTAPDVLHGLEPWLSDGTSAGTHMLADINPGLASSYPQSFAVVGTTLFFEADDGFHGQELWASSFAARRRAVRQ
jgi:ELWxxDGT repeat protein